MLRYPEKTDRVVTRGGSSRGRAAVAAGGDRSPPLPIDRLAAWKRPHGHNHSTGMCCTGRTSPVPGSWRRGNGGRPWARQAASSGIPPQCCSDNRAGPFVLPPGLADGFGLKGSALLAGARFTPRWWVPRSWRIRQSCAVWQECCLSSRVIVIVITITDYHSFPSCQVARGNLYVFTPILLSRTLTSSIIREASLCEEGG